MATGYPFSLSSSPKYASSLDNFSGIANNTDMAKLKGFLTVKEAAALIGVVDQRVRQMAAAGEIEATKIAGIWLIDAKDAKRVAGDPHDIGKPRGAKNLPPE